MEVSGERGEADGMDLTGRLFPSFSLYKPVVQRVPPNDAPGAEGERLEECAGR